MTGKCGIVLAASLLLSFLFGAPARADFQAGLEAYHRGAYEEAVPHLLRAAEASDPEAQYYLGLIYGDGEDRTRDLPKAAFWLDCAATAEGGIALRARRLKARLSQSLPEGESATDCPRTAQGGADTWSFDLFGSPELDRYHRPRASGASRTS